MYELTDYGRMFGEATRDAAYAAALRSVVSPDSVVLDLGAVVTEADAQHDSSTREEIERGDRLGERDRVVLGREQHAGSDLE